MREIPDTIPGRLKYWRETQLQISTAELAALVGVSDAAVSRYETGQRAVPLDFVVTLCERSGLSADWLLRREGDMRAPSEESARTLMGKIRALMENPMLELTSPDEAEDTQRVVETTEAAEPPKPKPKPKPKGRRKAGGG